MEAASDDGGKRLPVTASSEIEASAAGPGLTLDAKDLDLLFTALRRRGYTLLGPTLRDGAILYDEISTTRDLPIGWTDHQEPGRYRLERRGDGALFGYAVGPHSWKKFLFPPVQKLWQVTREGRELRFEGAAPDTRRRALIGVRSCELHAIGIQDTVFTRGPFVDPGYARRREGLFIVAVNCGQAAATCFCASMRTGPRAAGGFDICLTELLSGGPHRFLLETGSPAGAEVAGELPCRPAAPVDRAGADAACEAARRDQVREIPVDEVRGLLLGNLEHAQWDDVASRCLSCANCTLVCPTCFCSTVEDVTDLSGDHSERWRKWDSCFTSDFSFLHGGSVRGSTRSRYRQWMTHKLATWHDQFGTSGCVGCGRCLTWCPVGIDLTAEVAALRRTGAPPQGTGS
jgi:ferredoxin